MKTMHYLFALGCVVLAASPLLAETDIGREMNQLQDQHTKAVAAAIEPLKRRYQTSLEQLLKRATQANDLDTALRIREQLTVLGAAAVSPTAIELDGSAKNSREPFHKIQNSKHTSTP